MTTRTGLDAQVGVKLETTVGTAVTVDKFYEFDSEGMEYNPNLIEPSGLRVGVKFKRGSRLVQSHHSVAGDLTMQHGTRLMGTLWKVCLGSSVTTPTQIAATTAYKQAHQTGDLLGKSLTLQVGRPQPHTSTVAAHTFNGCKVTGWEFSCAVGQSAMLKLDLDGWNEATATALASASYVSSEVFGFKDATSFSLGGTIGGTTELTYTGGTAVTAIVKGITLKGDNTLATERIGLGSAGVKAEQLENGIPVISGSLDIEYNKTEWYDPFKANTSSSMLLKFTKSAIGASGEVDTLEFIIPQLRIKKVAPKVSGPDIVAASVEFEVYSNEVDNPFQTKIISADSTAI